MCEGSSLSYPTRSPSNFSRYQHKDKSEKSSRLGVGNRKLVRGGDKVEVYKIPEQRSRQP